MELDAAIERLYGALAHVPRPTAIEACPCCASAEEIAALLAPVPLADLPAPVVGDYAANSLMTVGGVADFRYFLPRLLQLSARDEFPWPDPELVFGHLRRAGWSAWPPPERDAVRDVLAALWAQTLDGYPSRPDIDTVLCAIGGAEDDLGPYLDRWAAAISGGTAPPAEQLRELLHEGARSTGDRWKLLNAFWERRDGPVADWLAGAELRAAIRAGFDAAGTEPALCALADLAALLGT